MAVLDLDKKSKIVLRDSDLEIKTTRSGGPGGQHVNKTDSAVIMTHKPSGLSVRVESRSQQQNRALAKEILTARLSEAAEAQQTEAKNANRKKQIGSGMRGDKIRTIALQRGQVTCHLTNRSISSKSYLNGNWEGLKSY